MSCFRLTNIMNELEKKYQKLQGIKRVENSSPVFNMNYPEEFKVNIRPDKSVSPGMFKPDPFIQGAYKAHPITIKALKKDIFMGGDEFCDLEDLYKCLSCSKEIDLQFWHFCPYCEASFPSKT